MWYDFMQINMKIAFILTKQALNLQKAERALIIFLGVFCYFFPVLWTLLSVIWPRLYVTEEKGEERRILSKLQMYGIIVCSAKPKKMSE